MKKNILVFLLFAFQINLFAQKKVIYEDIYQTIEKDKIIFGNNHLRLEFSKLNGAWTTLFDENLQTPLLKADNIAQTFDFQVAGKDILAQSSVRPKQFFARKNDRDEGVTMAMTYEAMDVLKRQYEFQLFYTLYPDDHSLERSASLVRVAGNQLIINDLTHFDSFIFRIPAISLGNQSDCVFNVPGSFLPTIFTKPDTPFDSLKNKYISFPHAPDAGLGIITLSNNRVKATLGIWMNTLGEVAYQNFLKGDGKQITLGQNDFRSVYFAAGTGIKSDVQHLVITNTLAENLAIFQEYLTKQFPLAEMPEWVSDMTILEVFPKYFKGGIRDFTAQLPYYKNIGFNTIYLMPHWVGGYSPIDPFRLDPAVGSREELREMVKNAHDLGMKVLFDMVIQGFNEASDYIQAKPTMFVKGEDGKLFRPHGSISISTDWASNDYQQFMVDLVKNDLKNYDIDGYRVHAATFKGAGWDPTTPNPAYKSGSASPELLKRMYAAMQEIKPETVLLSEVFGPVFLNVSNLGFDNLAGTPTQLLELMDKGKYTADDYRKHLAMVYATLPKGANRVFFARNHDTSWFYHFNGYTNRFLAFDAIHSFFGIPEFFAGDPEHEPNPGKEVYDYYQKLYQFRKKFPELTQGTINLEGISSNKPMIFSGIRSLNKQSSLVLISLSEKDEAVTFQSQENFPTNITFFDVISGEKFKIPTQGKTLTMRMKPFQILVGHL